jgi:hypothetical protein
MGDSQKRRGNQIRSDGKAAEVDRPEEGEELHHRPFQICDRIQQAQPQSPGSESDVVQLLLSRKSGNISTFFLERCQTSLLCATL